MQIAFTGVRHLTKSQEDLIYKHFSDISAYEAQWHVGDAPGLDALVRKLATDCKTLTVYEVKGHQKWHFAERSKRMVDAIANLENPWLYAFPNKLCPDGCKPCKSPNGNGSGTWLTIAYAHYRGVQIQIFPLEAITFPKWLEAPQQKQLKLF
ncbi:MAG: hypothetical protein ACIWVG_04455 [Gloeotrichia echinulata HAB0833]